MHFFPFFQVYAKLLFCANQDILFTELQSILDSITKGQKCVRMLQYNN